MFLLLISVLLQPDRIHTLHQNVIDVDDILSADFMPANLLMLDNTEESHKALINTSSGPESRGPEGNGNTTSLASDGSIMGALNTMFFHRSKMNEYLCRNFIAEQIIQDMSITRIKKRSGVGSDKRHKNTSLANHKGYGALRDNLIEDEGSTQYKSWLTKSTTLQDIYKHYQDVDRQEHGFEDDDKEDKEEDEEDEEEEEEEQFDQNIAGISIAQPPHSPPQRQLNAGPSSEKVGYSGPGYPAYGPPGVGGGGYYPGHGWVSGPPLTHHTLDDHVTVHHTEIHEAPKYDHDSKNLQELFEIVLTSLAYLSFGMFIVHVVMCIAHSKKKYKEGNLIVIVAPTSTTGTVGTAMSGGGNSAGGDNGDNGDGNGDGNDGDGGDDGGDGGDDGGGDGNNGGDDGGGDDDGGNGGDDGDGGDVGDGGDGGDGGDDGGDGGDDSGDAGDGGGDGGDGGDDGAGEGGDNGAEEGGDDGAGDGGEDAGDGDGAEEAPGDDNGDAEGTGGDGGDNDAIQFPFVTLGVNRPNQRPSYLNRPHGISTTRRPNTRRPNTQRPNTRRPNTRKPTNTRRRKPKPSTSLQNAHNIRLKLTTKKKRTGLKKTHKLADELTDTAAGSDSDSDLGLNGEVAPTGRSVRRRRRRRRRRKKRRVPDHVVEPRAKPTLLTPDLEGLNELARHVLTSVEAALVAYQDDGVCLRKTLCQSNRYSRSLENSNKMWIPVWSLGMSWLSGKLTKGVPRATSMLDTLKASILGLGKANCEVIFQECDLPAARKLRRRRRRKRK